MPRDLDDALGTRGEHRDDLVDVGFAGFVRVLGRALARIPGERLHEHVRGQPLGVQEVLRRTFALDHDAGQDMLGPDIGQAEPDGCRALTPAPFRKIGCGKTLLLCENRMHGAGAFDIARPRPSGRQLCAGRPIDTIARSSSSVTRRAGAKPDVRDRCAIRSCVGAQQPSARAARSSKRQVLVRLLHAPPCRPTAARSVSSSPSRA